MSMHDTADQTREPPQRTGWTGWRRFTVESVHPESEIITSFVLRPEDGGAVPRQKPGQHLTFSFDIPHHPALKRSYSISSAPNGETYRISVKREPKGVASNWLHGQVTPGTGINVGAPRGDFVLELPAKRPVVLLSAGVGLTPMVAMLETITQAQPDLDVHFIHGAESGATQAFRDYVRTLAAERPNIRTQIFHSSPRDTDVEGRDFDRAGRVDLDWVAAHTPLTDADYFVCGPVPFMRHFVTGLRTHGVPAERVHVEFFGPMEELFEDGAASAAPVSPGLAAPPASARPAPVTSSSISAEDVGASLVASQADAVVASDAEGRIVLWNPGAERIFGFAESEAVGRSLDIIIPEQFRQRHWDGYHETVATGQSRYGAGDLLAVPGLHKQGHRISIEFTIVLMKDEAGKVTGMVSSVRDVTKRFEEMKAMRKQIEGLTAKVPAG